MIMEIITQSREETMQLGEELGRRLSGGETILLNGDLGAGKTTFTKGLALGLDIVEDNITSPTFTILNEYEGRLNLFHFDMYRLSKDGDEELGFSEYYDQKDSVAVIEWNVSSYKFAKIITINISYIDENKRKVNIDGYPCD